MSPRGQRKKCGPRAVIKFDEKDQQAEIKMMFVPHEHSESRVASGVEVWLSHQA
jgi:hypothetical protein